LTSFAEPEGPKGTKTWVTVKGQPIAAWAGLWRDSEEWGPVYSGAMTDCNDAMRPLHDRMPVLLLPDDSTSGCARHSMNSSRCRSAAFRTN
jgi:putative SOS response-associated peptidase YedK